MSADPSWRIACGAAALPVAVVTAGAGIVLALGLEFLLAPPVPDRRETLAFGPATYADLADALPVTLLAAAVTGALAAWLAGLAALALRGRRPSARRLLAVPAAAVAVTLFAVLVAQAAHLDAPPR